VIASPPASSPEVCLPKHPDPGWRRPQAGQCTLDPPGRILVKLRSTALPRSDGLAELLGGAR